MEQQPSTSSDITKAAISTAVLGLTYGLFLVVVPVPVALVGTALYKFTPLFNKTVNQLVTDLPKITQ